MQSRAEARPNPRTFADAFDPRHNAFSFLRLVLALLVVFHHAFPLGGFGPDPLQAVTGGVHAVGSLAVAIFFVLSGFLICRSGLGAASVGRFLWHRFLRVFPGYWVCLLVCAFIFAPFIAWAEYGVVWPIFSVPKDSPQTFVLSNAGLFHTGAATMRGVFGFLYVRPYSIAGLLYDTPSPRAPNGSLWTLPPEFACYLGIAFLVACGVLRRARVLVLTFSAGLLVLHGVDCAAPVVFKSWLPARLSSEFVLLALCFALGALAFLYREKILCTRSLFAASTVVVTLALSVPWFRMVAPLAMTYAALWLAFKLPIRSMDARGDFSYGIYIYGFPLQQILALLRVHESGFAVYFLASLLATAVLAFLSYRWVEAPCLRLKGFQFRRAWRVEDHSLLRGDTLAFVKASGDSLDHEPHPVA